MHFMRSTRISIRIAYRMRNWHLSWSNTKITTQINLMPTASRKIKIQIWRMKHMRIKFVNITRNSRNINWARDRCVSMNRKLIQTIGYQRHCSVLSPNVQQIRHPKCFKSKKMIPIFSICVSVEYFPLDSCIMQHNLCSMAYSDWKSLWNVCNEDELIC